MPIRLKKHLTVRDHAAGLDGLAALQWTERELEVEDALPGGTSQVIRVWSSQASGRLYLRTHESQAARLKAEVEWLFDLPPGGYAIGKCISVAAADVVANA